MIMRLIVLGIALGQEPQTSGGRVKTMTRTQGLFNGTPSHRSFSFRFLRFRFRFQLCFVSVSFSFIVSFLLSLHFIVIVSLSFRFKFSFRFRFVFISFLFLKFSSAKKHKQATNDSRASQDPKGSSMEHQTKERCCFFSYSLRFCFETKTTEQTKRQARQRCLPPKKK